MAEALFHVIADGHPIAGFDAAAVAQQLQLQLQLTPAQAQRLLGGKPIAAKRGVTHAIAEKYCARLAALGVQVHIEASAEISATPAPALAASTNYFPNIAKPLTSARNGARYLQRLLLATAQASTLALSYVGIALLGILLLIFYSWHFGYLLTAPPLLFSIPMFVIPWLALALGVVWLLRPFYPLRPALFEPVALHPQLQPELFQWLAQLCEVIAVSMPTEIAIDTRLANTVALRAGAKAFWHGEAQLVLSLPLLDIGNLRDSSGNIAAALGTQATPLALRCNRTIKIIDERLQACLENRDWLSAQLTLLEQKMSTSKMRLAIAALRQLSAQHNRLLAYFVQRLAALQQRLQRHTVLEADRLQTLFTGSTHFIESLLQQHKLAEAYRDANALNFADRSAGGLVANLPALIRHYYDNFDSKIEQQLRAQWSDASARNSRSDTTTPGERIAAVQARNDAGVIDADAPASTLFSQYTMLASEVTAAYYTELGLEFDRADLLPTDDLTFAATEEILHKQQAALYFNNWFKPFRFWRVADYTLLRDMPTNDAAQQLSVCVNEIRRLTPDRMRLLSDYERLQNQLQELLLGQLVLAQRRPFQFRYLSYDGTTLQPLIEERQQQIAKIVEQLTTQETIMGGRIGLGLRLSGQAQRDAEDLHNALLRSSVIENRLYKLSLDVYLLEQLVQRHHQQREADYSAPLKRLEDKISESSALLHERLKEIPYPLDPRYATLNEYATTSLEKLQGEKLRTEKSPRRRSASASAVLDRAQHLLRLLYEFNEALARRVADCGTIAEEAYQIEAIKLIETR